MILHFYNRFLSNNAQTPNTKTKIATLKFLKTLTTSYDVSNNFYYQEPASKALLKIINFSSDPKSSELRTEAKYCLVAIYNCNTVKVTIKLILTALIIYLYRTICF